MAVLSARFNEQNYGSYIPPAWGTGSFADHLLMLVFQVLDYYESGPMGWAFSEAASAAVGQMDWGDQDYLERYVHSVACRVYEGLTECSFVQGEGAYFNVLLRTSGAQRLHVMKVLRQHLILDLARAKRVVDQAPICIATAIEDQAASGLVQALEKAGATVELESCSHAWATSEDARCILCEERLSDLVEGAYQNLCYETPCSVVKCPSCGTEHVVSKGVIGGEVFGVTLVETTRGVSAQEQGATEANTDGPYTEVVLTDVGPHRIHVAKVARELGNLALGAAEGLLRSAPATILRTGRFEEATVAQRMLERTSAHVLLRHVEL